MAACEKCHIAGYDPRQMFVDTEAKSFIGPCCKDTVARAFPIIQPLRVLPAEQQGAEYGVEVSNRVGVRAYVNYAGLQVTFERSPKEIKAWAERQGLITEQAV